MNTGRLQQTQAPQRARDTRPLTRETPAERGSDEPARPTLAGDRDATVQRRANTASLSLDRNDRAAGTAARTGGASEEDHATDILMRGCVPAAFASMWRQARPAEARRVADQLAAGETVRINDLPLSVSARDRARIEAMNLSPAEKTDAYLQFGIMGAGKYLQGSPAERNAINANRGTSADWDMALTQTGLGERGVQGLASRLDIPVKFVEADFAPGDFVAYGPRGNKHAVQVVDQQGDRFTVADAYGNERHLSRAQLQAGAALEAGDDIGSLTAFTATAMPVARFRR